MPGARRRRGGVYTGVMLTTGVLGGADAVDEMRAEWQEIVDDAPTATPFQSWEWQSTWLKHYRRTKKPHLVTIREGNDLVGLMPLTRTGGPWRTIRAMGTGASDYLHPIAREGYENQVASAVSAHLAEMSKIDLIDLHQIRQTQPLAQAAKCERVLEQAICLLLDLPPTYEEYLGTLGKSLRYDVRRLEKTLFKEGRAVIEPVTEERIGEGLEILFEQHKKRWRKRGLPGAFLGRTQKFHHEWGRLAARRGWLWLGILKLDGEAIGAIYAMRMGETCYYYQAGFDPDKGSISPGTLLVAATIKRSIEEGLRHFDFLRGDEPYKRRWKPQHELKNVRILRAHNPMRGGIGITWNGAGSRVEACIRARLEGKGLI